MSIKTILVCLADYKTGLTSLKTAYEIGKIFNSHIEALHVRIDSVYAVPYAGEGVSGAMVAEMMKLAEKEADECTAKTHKMFEEFCQSNNISLTGSPHDSVSAHWREESGSEDDIVSMLARINDLTVLNRPKTGREIPSLETFNTTLLYGGMSVLVAPKDAPKNIGKNIAIAWNGTPESALAVSAAKPFLTKADSVMIFITEEADDEIINAKALKNYLTLNNVNAEIKEMPSKSSNVGEEILSAVKENKSDLLVMGAYTHNCVRRLILGGITKHVLDNTTIPILLSH